MHFGIDILISRPFMDGFNVKSIHEQLESGVLRRVIMDCGAFSYNRKGIELSVEDYIEYLRNLSVPIWRYFALDVIGNSNATMDNLRKMYDAGLTPIPIWQRGMTRNQIDEMYEMSDLVAIGGVVGRPHLLEWVLRKLWPKGKKLHILGLGAPKRIFHYNPYSVDNSNFAEYRWEKMGIYVGGNRWLTPISYGMKPTKEHRRMIERCGFDSDLLKRRSVWYDYRHSNDGMPPLMPIPGSIGMIMWQLYALDLRARGLTRVFMAFCKGSDFVDSPIAMERAKMIFQGEV